MTGFSLKCIVIIHHVPCYVSERFWHRCSINGEITVQIDGDVGIKQNGPRFPSYLAYNLTLSKVDENQIDLPIQTCVQS